MKGQGFYHMSCWPIPPSYEFCGLSMAHIIMMQPRRFHDCWILFLKVFFINLEEFGVWLSGMLVVKSCSLRLVLIGIHFPILLSLHVIVYLDSIQVYKILWVVRIMHYHEISLVPISWQGHFICVRSYNICSCKT